MFLFKDVIRRGGGTLVVQPPRAAESQKQQNEDFTLKHLVVKKNSNYQANYTEIQ